MAAEGSSSHHSCSVLPGWAGGVVCHDKPMRCSKRDTGDSPYDTDQRCSMWAAMSTSR